MRIFDPVAWFRLSRWMYLRGIPFLPRIIDRLNQAVFHCYLYHQTIVGDNLTLLHHGFGVVINPRSRIGKGVFISQCVTIGGRSESDQLPVIEDNVYIASGAKVLGGLVVGEGAVIGANAVVIQSVQARSVVAGVPARVIREGINVLDFVESETEHLHHV
jgi:serine O-acetyltransferase